MKSDERVVLGLLCQSQNGIVACTVPLPTYSHNNSASAAAQPNFSQGNACVTSRLGGGPTEYQAACALAGRAGQAGGGTGTSPGRKSNLSRRGGACRPPRSEPPQWARCRPSGRCLPQGPCLCQATCCSAHGVGLASSISSFNVQLPALYAALSCRCNISDGPGRCDWACAGEGNDAGQQCAA